METLSCILDKRDGYTASHSKRVAGLATALAQKLKLNRYEIEQIKIAAELHDLGKVAIPDQILSKPGALTKEEYTEMKKHATIGWEILNHLSKYQKEAKLVLYHHEWFNGEGYPKGLSGNRIPLGSRIIAVADAYDAMNSNRVYRKALEKEEIMRRFNKGKGKQFDPIIVAALKKLNTLAPATAPVFLFALLSLNAFLHLL